VGVLRQGKDAAPEEQPRVASFDFWRHGEEMLRLILCAWFAMFVSCSNTSSVDGNDGGTSCAWPAIPLGEGCLLGGPTATGAAPLQIVLDGGTQIRANITYATRGGRVLQGDLFVPPPTATKPGVVVLVHGGGWRDCGQRRAALSSLALFFSSTLNVSVYNIEYRLTQEGGAYPENVNDVKCALRFMAANAAQYGLDGSKVVVMGESAGGHLALMAGITDSSPSLDIECGKAPALRAIVAYSAPTDLPAFRLTPSAAKDAPAVYTQSLCNTAVTPCVSSCDRCIDASPLAHACSAKAPMLLVHAPEPYDALVATSQSQRLADALSAQGAAVKLLIPTPLEIEAQRWGDRACSAQAGIAHGFQSPCLLTPTFVELQQFMVKALSP
jgi:acetyl esterase/lipase